MKILVLSITLSTSVLTGAFTDPYSLAALPDGLELGKTLRTDLDPTLQAKDGFSFFADAYDAHFGEMGFLEKVVIDRTKGHLIPDSWNLSWNDDLTIIKASLAEFGVVKSFSRDMSKSPTVNSFQEVELRNGKYSFKFHIIDWKEGSNNIDGLSAVVIQNLQ